MYKSVPGHLLVRTQTISVVKLHGNWLQLERPSQLTSTTLLSSLLSPAEIIYIFYTTLDLDLTFNLNRGIQRKA